MRARLDVTPRVEAVLERATIVLLIAVALTSTLFIGSDVAGPARPIGVAVGILAAVLRAPLIVVIVAAAGTTAALRAAGMA
ncbi:AzlD domain-containing protein [Gordonia effusa]|uniref:AzlD domain-containing protein n=1 Tax=Gordonia effusa TaxID=263908 RepID=UPI0035712F73